MSLEKQAREKEGGDLFGEVWTFGETISVGVDLLLGLFVEREQVRAGSETTVSITGRGRSTVLGRLTYEMCCQRYNTAARDRQRSAIFDSFADDELTLAIVNELMRSKFKTCCERREQG